MPKIILYQKINSLIKLLLFTTIVVVSYFLFTSLDKNSAFVQINNINYTEDEQVSKIVASEMTFKGLSKNQIPYVINSAKAFKTSDDLYELNKVEGFYYPLGHDLRIKGDTGILNNSSNLISLKGGVNALGYGFNIKSEHMDINLLTEEIIGKENVELNYKNLNINANKFNIIEKNLIIIEGNVKTAITFE